MAPRDVVRFDGEIAGLGTAAGVRIVLGLWRGGPFGPMTDAMVEDADGHRVLVAPSVEVAEYIAATYSFDEVRVEDVVLDATGNRRAVRSRSLHVELRTGRRTGVGRLLRVVPAPLARSRGWCRAINGPARLLRPGVRTVGTAGGGRREFYGAQDEHRIELDAAGWDGADLGGLTDVEPPVRFGFGSTPPRPALVRVTTTIVS